MVAEEVIGVEQTVPFEEFCRWCAHHHISRVPRDHEDEEARDDRAGLDRVRALEVGDALLRRARRVVVDVRLEQRRPPLAEARLLDVFRSFLSRFDDAFRVRRGVEDELVGV